MGPTTAPAIQALLFVAGSGVEAVLAVVGGVSMADVSVAAEY